MRERIGRAVVEYGCSFPPLSDDPLENWLLEEAILTAYHIESRLERAEQEQLEEQRTDALEQAKELLGRHREAQGYV